MTDPRQTAAEMLQNILENKTFFSDVKNRDTETPATDSAFINMLVLTTLRHLVFIKKTLKKFVKKKLPPNVAFGEYILFLGAAEILYLDTPDYAVINTYVDIAKKTTDKYVGGFINAVFRNLCRQKAELIQTDTGEFFTAEFFRILNQDYGKKTVQKIQTAAQKEPELDITVKSDAAVWAEKLDARLLPGGTVRLKNRGRITELPGYKDGAWWVQDFAASLAVKTLGNITSQKVLDLCAAPGGKTAQLIQAGAEVTALDISESRLKTLHENLARLDLSAKEIICADALDWLKKYDSEKFDAILLDAPCSATGTVRRHPELVHIKNLKDVQKLAELQKDFLSLVGNALKKDGLLVYCTCSVTKTEGEKQITAFLQNNPDFVNFPVTSQELCGDDQLKEIITEEGYIRTLPQHLETFGGTDAFFVARLKKVY